MAHLKHVKFEGLSLDARSIGTVGNVSVILYQGSHLKTHIWDIVLVCQGTDLGS